MSTRLFYSGVLLVFTALLVSGQLLFKGVALAIEQRGGSSIKGVLYHPALYGAVAVYGAATVLWIWILTRVPLTQAYPWVALSIVFVPLLATVVFGETVRPWFWLGVGLVTAGLIITQYNSVS